MSPDGPHLSLVSPGTTCKIWKRPRGVLQSLLGPGASMNLCCHVDHVQHAETHHTTFPFERKTKWEGLVSQIIMGYVIIYKISNFLFKPPKK